MPKEQVIALAGPAFRTRGGVFRRLVSWRFSNLDIYLTEEGENRTQLRDVIQQAGASNELPVRIWITSKAFVCRGDKYLARLPPAYRAAKFYVVVCGGGSTTTTSSTTSRFGEEEETQSSPIFLSVHAASVKEANTCVSLLCRMKDEFYSELEIRPGWGKIHSGEHFACPLEGSQLREEMSKKRKLRFFRARFDTASQCEALAAPGSGDTELRSCAYLDGGSSFVTALVEQGQQARKEEQGKMVFTFNQNIPFEREHWSKFQGLTNGRGGTRQGFCIELKNISLTEQDCLAMASAGIHSLRLVDCRCEDRGIGALTQASETSEGLRDLSIILLDRGHNEKASTSAPFLTTQGWRSFAKALKDSHLERLQLKTRDGFWRRLGRALSENTRLQHLNLDGSLIKSAEFYKFLQVLARHPSLRSIEFPTVLMNGWVDVCQDAKEKRTRTVAEMLEKNKRLENIQFPQTEDLFDRALWNSMVVPKLEQNLYCQRSKVSHNSGKENHRAAVLGRALSHTTTDVTLTWLLLQNNPELLQLACSE